MATVFQNLRARGTLVVVGLTTLGTAVITTLTLTTGNITTANITTANVQTVSGSTIRAKTATAATLVIGGAGDKKNQAVCFGTGGALGYCTNAVSAAGVCSCFVP